jgi:hypothetical protein
VDVLRSLKGDRRSATFSLGHQSWTSTHSENRSFAEVFELFVCQICTRLYGLSMLWERCTKQNASFQRRPLVLKTRHLRDAVMPYSYESPLQSLFCGDDLQIIGHRKDSGDAVGAEGDHVLVGFAVHDALQGNLTALHDDADRLLHAERVFL